MTQSRVALAMLLGFGLSGGVFAESGQPPASASRLKELAEQYLAASKERLKAKEAEDAQREQTKQTADAERQRARGRAEAQKLAIEMTREKLKRQTTQDRESQQQVQLAHER